MQIPFFIRYNLRKYTPEKIKRVLRAIRLGITSWSEDAPEIPQHLLNDARLLSNRDYMLTLLPKDAVVCEIGVLYGDYTRQILNVCKPKELHLIDVDFEETYPDVKNAKNVTLHQGLSVEKIKAFPDNYFDWIYIDADHSYEGVKADIVMAQSKVKVGGFLIFNDFARIVHRGLGTFGVHQAVCEFSSQKEWPFVYLCLNGQALYDVALRRPQ